MFYIVDNYISLREGGVLCKSIRMTHGLGLRPSAEKKRKGTVFIAAKEIDVLY